MEYRLTVSRPAELDQVAAYDRLAAEYANISARRRAYLDAIERLVIAHVPADAHSMLDIGAGDGRRAVRIAYEAGISSLTLLEPSSNMRQTWPASVQAWPLRAEELAHQQGSFDVITCLWNVLGHIFPSPARQQVLRQIARLLRPGGAAFIDVSHRYNGRHYGFFPTLIRMTTDLLRTDTGDVLAKWTVAGQALTTRGHVFTDREMTDALHAAGLTIAGQHFVDYRTGDPVASRWLGHLFYRVVRAT